MAALLDPGKAPGQSPDRSLIQGWRMQARHASGVSAELATSLLSTLQARAACAPRAEDCSTVCGLLADDCAACAADAACADHSSSRPAAPPSAARAARRAAPDPAARGRLYARTELLKKPCACVDPVPVSKLDQPRPRGAAAARPPLYALGLLAIGLTLSLLLAQRQTHNNEHLARTRFEQLCLRLADHLVERVTSYESGLRAVRGVIVAIGPDDITRTAFRAYNDSCDIAHAYPGARGFGFIRRVPLAQESEFVGAARAEHGTLSGKHLREVLGDDLFEQNLAQVQAVLRGEPQTFERTIRRHDGPGAHHGLTHYLPDVVDGELRGFYVLVHDVTELREARAAAEAASAAKSEFLANMSHEIRTPLNAILGLTHLMSGSALAPEQRDFVDKIQLAGRALLGVLNDVLDLSKIEAAEVELEHAPFEPGALLVELEQLVSPQARSKGLTLHVRQTGELPVRLSGDVTRLRQVLLNLLSNAIKFTERGQVELELVCEQTTPQRALLSCTVRDTGIGIPLEAQARIFSPFTQADTSTTRRFGGTGLGLSIARRLTELMGGELSLRSQPGQGSEFQVRLSLQLTAAGETPPRRLLVADDEPVSRVALGAMARALGYEVESVESGEQLCERVRAAPAFDAILLDWQMPGLSGLQALARLSQAGLPLPAALLISACPSAELRGTPHLELVREVLEKPVRLPELSRVLRAALDVADEPGDDVELLPDVRVLVVDDSAINLEVAQRILQREGALVSTAADGGQALALLRAQPDAFDAVLMDVQMPVMDGHAATRRIRQELQLLELPVIALTAGALVSERQRALEAGMTAFATKPLDPRSLGQLVRKQVQSVRAEPLPTRPRASVADGTAPPAIPGLRWSLLAPALRREPASLYALLEQLLADAAELQRAGLRVDAARTAGQVHRLRGSAASLGALELAERAGAVERALVAQDVCALEAALPALEAALHTLRELGLPALAALRPAPAAGQSA